MKEIEYYIESNKKLLQKSIDKFEETDPNNKNELERIKINIERFTYYIKGLEDAKKYIEEEK